MQLPTGNGIIRPAFHLFHATLCLLTLLLSCQTNFSTPNYKIEELCSFPPGAGGESGPRAGVVFGPDGAFYGTTYGTFGSSNDCGTVFRVTIGGDLTTLVSFVGTNGRNPQAALLLGSDGAFYGGTAGGITWGTFDARFGYGTLFRVTTNGDLMTLVHFKGTNGGGPCAELVLGNDGAFYGSTLAGGLGDYGGYGTVFRLTTNYVLTTLALFDGTNGLCPYSNLIPTQDGAVYGTTIFAHPTPPSFAGFGNLFCLSNGVLTDVTAFRSSNYLQRPRGKLIRAADGALFGTTEGGAVFRATGQGELTKVAAFSLLEKPIGGLVIGSDGAFYGTIYRGGGFDKGGVFRCTTNGILTVIAAFTGTNGANSYSALVEGKDGAFYGTTSSGGSLGGGNVFRIVVFSHLDSCERLSNGCLVRFSGVEGETYRLERSTNLSGPWLTLTNFTLDASRQAQFLDTNAPATAAFYRTATP